MNEEEKKAIETMQHWIEYEKENKDKINKADELIEIQETVSSLLEKKDKQINSKNEIINALHDALKERTEERDKKDDIITKQGKIINLIYDFLYKFGSKFSGSFMKALSEDGFDIKKCENCEYETCDCKECIKQYFERKVENG